MKKIHGLIFTSFLTAATATHAGDIGLPRGASPLCDGSYYLSLTDTKYPIDREFTKIFTNAFIEKVNSGLHNDITVEEYFNLFQNSFMKTSAEFETLIAQQDLKPALTVGGFRFSGQNQINYGTNHGLAYSLNHDGKFGTAYPDAIDMLFFNADIIEPGPINIGVEFKNYAFESEPEGNSYSVHYTLVEGFANRTVLTRDTKLAGLKIEQYYDSSIVPAISDYDFDRGGSHTIIYCRPDEDGPALT